MLIQLPMYIKIIQTKIEVQIIELFEMNWVPEELVVSINYEYGL